MNENRSNAREAALTEQQVLDYLHARPAFLQKHTDLLRSMVPPERDLGGGIVDFQAFQLKNLQANAKSLQGKYEGLVSFCRDNLSVQAQVHKAVLKLIAARSLEQLLEALTVDFLSLFDLDVVRLCVESEIVPGYDTFYSEDNYSGIVFVPPGAVESVTMGQDAVLVDDCSQGDMPELSFIFADCEGLVESCALLPMDLLEMPRHALLALGVRYKDRFHSGQASDLLSFLAEVTGHQLDRYLSDMDTSA